MALKVGDKAPEILGISQDGKEIKLSDYSGRKLILYFYPKDNNIGLHGRGLQFARQLLRTACKRL